MHIAHMTDQEVRLVNILLQQMGRLQLTRPVNLPAMVSRDASLQDLRDEINAINQRARLRKCCDAS